MYEIKSIVRLERLAAIVHALHAIPDVPGLTVSTVRGYGKRVPPSAAHGDEFGETEMAKLETVVPDHLLQQVLDTVQRVGSTGRPGDGNVFVVKVEEAIKIRSGTRGAAGL